MRRGRARNHCCSPLSLPCRLLCTQVCGQSHTPLGARQGKEETSNPASALCRTVGRAAGTAGQPWAGKAQGFSRNGSREQVWKAQRLMRGGELLHCRDGQKQNHKGTLITIGRSTDQGSFPEQQRANNIFLFHQLYSSLSNTEGCGVALQEFENHPSIKQSSPSPTGMRKGRIQVLWQPNRVLSDQNISYMKLLPTKP